MVKRTLQCQGGSYVAIIPAALIDVVGLKTGDLISFGLQGKKITLELAVPNQTQEESNGTKTKN